MQLYESSFNFNTPESWLILVTYAGFWIYGYYSLVVFLVHIHKQNKSIENIELEEN